MKRQIRWMVRLQLARELKFGENPRDALAWTVTPYEGRWPDGSIRALSGSTFFRQHIAALAYARVQMTHHYARGPKA